MDRTGDTVELQVEHATDLRICDLLDDPIPISNSMAGRKASDVGINALQIGNFCHSSLFYPRKNH